MYAAGHIACHSVRRRPAASSRMNTDVPPHTAAMQAGHRRTAFKHVKGWPTCHAQSRAAQEPGCGTGDQVETLAPLGIAVTLQARMWLVWAKDRRAGRGLAGLWRRKWHGVGNNFEQLYKGIKLLILPNNRARSSDDVRE